LGAICIARACTTPTFGGGGLDACCATAIDANASAAQPAMPPKQRIVIFLMPQP
jgi:hypothetical protein